MSELYEYLKKEWADYSPAKIDANDGHKFANWLIQNDADEYETMMDCTDISDAQYELSAAIVSKDDILGTLGELQAMIRITARDYLIEKINEYNECFEEREELDKELSEEHDKQRLM